MKVPFKYPHSRHSRIHETLTSKPKAQLREEFTGQCIYCCKPDSFPPSHDSFGVDHYWPKSKFERMKSDVRNLFYACNACNRRKGAWFPTCRDLQSGVFFANPCYHTMAEHLQFDEQGGRVITHTQAGEFMEAVFDLNEGTAMIYRELVTGLIKDHLRFIEKLVSDREKTSDPAGKASITDCIAREQFRLAALCGASQSDSARSGDGCL